jgi:AcrR family transcriptional regulator
VSSVPASGSPTARSTPRERLPAGERRKAVLDSACRVFVKTSYRGATTAEIAREAGITEPILYRHFGSKRDLYIACLDEAWRIFREFAEQALAENPTGCLGAIMDAYMAKRAKLRLVDLWIQALGEVSEEPLIAKAVRRQIREVHAFVADVIRRGQADGVLHADRDPEAEAWTFVACGLLATIDQRLGGLLGDDLARVRASRRAWMAI